ncbi:P-hydroxybenzoic acid efflux pump subunit AaeB like [Actinidia chinensis var. chinensis]|uniref:p-hydroxybenzoic acid efflux pump subunit AaeB like n=1 Tax=Actinidia chinensis var. chinensis TaxID=1590841 RepID=A0A2R6PXJ9_ACTCC|nr:P-hydroxybenzoic acid efflux pump subunit AaeB like [Actinidia chinensis var. chinensis]
MAAVAVAGTAFVVAVPEGTHLMAKRIAFGQIVIVYVGAVIHGENTGVIMHPIHVAASTALGALASVLALLLPYPRLAHFEVRKLCGMYTQNAAQRISLFVKAFSAQNNTIALEAIFQVNIFAETAAKLLHNIKLIQEGVLWERPQIRTLKPHFTNPGDRLQDMEIPVRGMEMALTSSPYFPLSFIDQELGEVLMGLEVQIGLKLEQAKCFLPINEMTATKPTKGELFNKFLESIRITNPTSKDLPTIFFLSCIKLLLDDSSATQNPKRFVDSPEETTSGFFKRFCSSWCTRPKNETLVFALKCSLALGLAVFLGLTFNEENGYWSGLTIAISFTAERQATFTIANARAQGTAMGSVYGVLGCFFFRKFDEVRVLALLPWIIFTSFLRHSRMYGQAGGISAVIGALLILGRKNYGAPAEFAIARLTEAFIGLFCFIMVELLMQPTRAATLAKNQLSGSLGMLRECIREVGLPPNQKDMDLVFPTWRAKQEKLKDHVNELEKFAGEADLEPNFWFSPFRIECYNKLLVSISKMKDLLLFTSYIMEFLVEESHKCGVVWRELEEHVNSNVLLFKENVSSSLDYLEKITLIKSFAITIRDAQARKIYDDLELGKSPNADACKMHTDEEEAGKIVSSFLQRSKELTDKIEAQAGERRAGQIALSLSAIGFCIGGLMTETKAIEKGIKELVQWENPSTRIDFYEIYGKINALFPR